MALLQSGEARATATLWRALLDDEPRLALSVARNTLRHLELRGYVVGETLELVHVPGGRQRRWSLTDLGRRVLERYEQIQPHEQRRAA